MTAPALEILVALLILIAINSLTRYFDSPSTQDIFVSSVKRLHTQSCEIRTSAETGNGLSDVDDERCAENIRWTKSSQLQL